MRGAEPGATNGIEKTATVLSRERASRISADGFAHKHRADEVMWIDGCLLGARHCGSLATIPIVLSVNRYHLFRTFEAGSYTGLIEC
jgi:hypothetical protein